MPIPGQAVGHMGRGRAMAGLKQGESCFQSGDRTFFRQWHSYAHDGNTPSCLRFAPLTVLSPRPRLAGTPSTGKEVWNWLGKGGHSAFMVPPSWAAPADADRTPRPNAAPAPTATGRPRTGGPDHPTPRTA